MIICFILAITVIFQITEAYLPGSARLTDSCPQPNNLTAWTIAARKMNCSQYIPANIRNKDLYHCLPSIFLNETIEFCGKNQAIGKGYCPVYDYTKNATVATSRSCKHFTTGCPEPPNPYHSLQFYKQSECLSINKKSRCYHADPSCSKVEHSISSLPPIDTSSESSVSGSASREASTPGYETIPSTSSSEDLSGNSNIPGWIFVLIVVIAVLAVAVGVLVGIIIAICRRKRDTFELPDGPYKDPLLGESPNTETRTNDVELTECKVVDNGHTAPLSSGKYETSSSSKKLYEEKRDNLNDEKKDQENEPNKDNSDTIEEPPLRYTSTVPKSRNVGNCGELKDVIKVEVHENEPNKYNSGAIVEPQICNTSTVSKRRNVGNYDMNPGKDQISTDEEDEGEDQLEYNAFYYKLREEIIKRNLIKDFKRLLKDPTDKNTPADDRELLDHWDEKHKFWCNMWHLQKLLQMCKADDLVERCEKFATENMQLMRLYYFTRTTTGGDREILEVHTSYCLEDKRVRNKMEKIRKRLSKCLDYAPDQIRLIGIEHGSLIFVFSLPEVNIQNLKDLCVSKIWRMGVFKIETSHHIIKPGSGLQKKTSEIAVQPWNPTTCCQNSCPKEKEMNNEVARRLLHENEDNGSCIWITGSNIKRLVQVYLLRINVQTSLILKSNVHACIQAVVQEMYKSFQRSGSNGQVYGNQATVELKRQTPRASRKKAYKDKFLQNQVFEEMEPNVILGILKMQYPVFYKDFEKNIRPGNCRREKAENIFNHLKEMKGKKPKDMQNDIIEKCRVASHSEKQSTDDLKISYDKESVKRKISSQRNDLVEEIDSTIINDTMEKLGLSDEKYIQLFHANSGKPRRDRATALLDFILVNEDCLLPFDGILYKYDLCIQ